MDNLVFRNLAEQAPTDSENVSQVIADHFLSIGDPKGELINLEHEINRMLNNKHRNLKQNQRKLARLQREKEKLMGNIDIPLPLYLPQFYFNQTYNIVKGKPYARAVHKLRQHLEAEKNKEHPRFKLDEEKSIYRPLTLEESVEVLVVDYWTLKNPDGSNRTEDERKRLFNDYQDTCTGIAYQKPEDGEPVKFKIDPECRKLITLDENFRNAYRQINYSEFDEKEFEIDGSYNRDLTFEEFMVHRGHAAAILDKALRRAYGEIVFAERKNRPSLGFYILERNEIEEDQLRALYVDHLDGDAGVDGGYDLDNVVHFLRVAQMESERSEV